MTAQKGAANNGIEELPMWSIPVSHGLAVIPLRWGTKLPAIEWKKYQNQPATPQDIAAWQRSNFNVGIVTGHISGIVVLDLDSEDAVREAERQGLPHTVRVRTPRGRHIYFRHPGYRVASRVSLFPGADVRADPGYVVAPGSRYQPTGEEQKNGKVAGEYSWENSPDDTEIAECPAWLLKMLSECSSFKEDFNGGAAQDNPNTAQVNLQDLVDCVRNATVGTRNSELNRCAFVAGGWVQQGRITLNEATDGLRAAALAAGLDLAEIAPTLASGLNAGKEKAVTDGTEDGVANLFATEHADTFQFDHDRGTWFQFTGSHWAADSKLVALHLIRETARRLSGASKALRRASSTRGAEGLARSDPRLSVLSSDWDKDPFLLGTPGGTVDLNTGRLRPSIPSDRITKVTSVAPSDAEPERWLRFLRDTTGNDLQFIAFLQRMCGYLLTGDTREQVLFFIYGGGGNGKSVFLNTIQTIMNDYAEAAPMDAFTVSKFQRHPTELAMMSGARLVSASETGRENTWDEAKVKQLTGGDRISARFMRQDFFTFVPAFKLLIAGNHRPTLQSVDEATRRRFRVLPFERMPPAPDPLLSKKLQAEHSGILTWMIAGCSEWQKKGLGSARAIDLATRGYLEEQDQISEWVREACKVGSSLRCPPQQLFGSWTHYCHSRGMQPGTMLTFGEALERHGFPRRKSNGVRYHEGLSVTGFEDLSAGSDT